jgi:hypothetical protein
MDGVGKKKLKIELEKSCIKHFEKFNFAASVIREGDNDTQKEKFNITIIQLSR